MNSLSKLVELQQVKSAELLNGIEVPVNTLILQIRSCQISSTTQNCKYSGHLRIPSCQWTDQSTININNLSSSVGILTSRSLNIVVVPDQISDIIYQEQWESAISSDNISSEDGLERYWLDTWILIVGETSLTDTNIPDNLFKKESQVRALSP